ncbi:MAG: epoxide hydrolase [Gammaproteobacteria bacterium]|nr:epoxide hydrolase [Gammaproteobacteria bacterium]
MSRYTTPEPFSIDVSDAVLTDLRERLERVRWPGEVPNSAWDYGTNLAYMKELVDYWRTRYDWRVHERQLNRWTHFRVIIDGQRLHYIHERGKGPKPFPLIITHGWPGSIAEFVEIIGPLTDPAAHGGDPADAFDVIAPSLPGYGFSDPTHDRQVNITRIAEWFAVLMNDVLGYTRYGAQGGDWGAMVTSRLGFADADHVAGIHLNMVGVAPHPANRQNLSPTEQTFLQSMDKWRNEETGYQGIQGTKPQTLGYALNDSPVGLCAWIVEKFRTWSDCNGNVENSYTKDQLLTNIMIYWATQTINSSTRLYFEERQHPWRMGKNDKVTVPTAIALFPKEIATPPREWAERAYNIQRWTPMPAGGHFAAMEKPQLLVDDVRAFFRELR